MHARIILVAALLIGMTSSVYADDVADAQTLIRAQDEAISRDDAAGAYFYAAPVIKRVFPEPAIFMTMVRHGYAPLYKPKQFEFGKGQALDGGVAQLVYLVDSDGVAWEALYMLEKQPDGSLKITGCTIRKATTA
ncbi:MAG: DUF4864 domain-containing protein [Afipia sp.]|nr:DUF4864 domain-containing protein [Afipia sp.]